MLWFFGKFGGIFGGFGRGKKKKKTWGKNKKRWGGGGGGWRGKDKDSLPKTD